MKKTLIALAALAAVGAVSAQVTLYGKLDAGVSMTTTNAGAAGEQDLVVNKVHSGNQSGSRWGMKGSEDLGGGLTASFQLENSIGLDVGSSTGFTRQAFIALSGGFGALSFGRQYTAIDNTWGIYDAMQYTGASAMSYAWNSNLIQPLNAASPATNGAHQDMARRDNTVQYTLPAMGGFGAYIQVSPGEDNNQTTRSAGNFASVGATYTSGQFSVGAAYENATVTTAAVAAGTATALQSNTAAASGTAAACAASTASAATIARFTNINGVCTTAIAAAASTSIDISNTTLMGSYDLGVVKVHLGFEQGKTPTTQDVGYALGISIPLGAANIQAGYATERLIADGSTVDGLSKAFGAQVQYDLSKRTNLYASFVSGTVNSPVATSQTAQPESKLQNVAVGVRHSF